MNGEQILVLGFGNEVLTDDGIGVKLVKQLKIQNADPHFVYETSWLGGLEILEYFKQNYNKAVLIDAIKTGRDKPGTIRKYNLDNFKETLHLSNLHDADFLNTIKLGKMLGYHIPSSIHIVSIEIVEDEEFADSFSDEIEKKYDEILDSLNSIIIDISNN